MDYREISTTNNFSTVNNFAVRGRKSYKAYNQGHFALLDCRTPRLYTHRHTPPPKFALLVSWSLLRFCLFPPSFLVDFTSLFRYYNKHRNNTAESHTNRFLRHRNPQPFICLWLRTTRSSSVFQVNEYARLQNHRCPQTHGMAQHRWGAYISNHERVQTCFLYTLLTPFSLFPPAPSASCW